MKKQTIQYFDEQQALEMLKDAVGKAGSQKEYATTCGIAPQYLSDIIQGRRNLANDALEPLGLEKKTIYVPIVGGTANK